MPDYSSRYLFEARAIGVTRTSNQLNALARALWNVGQAGGAAKAGLAGMPGLPNVPASGGTPGAAGSGGASVSAAATAATPARSGGNAYTESYIPSGPQIARALSYSAAIAGAYAAMGLVIGATERWVESQVEFNRVMVDAQNILGGTSEEVANFADQVRYLSFVSGESFSETALVARREQVLGRPGMGAAAAALNVVFPSLDFSTTAEDVTAIQTQFDASFTDINDVLLGLVQTSGLTADELLSMSETWGALVDDMRLGDRSLETMREVGGLMASMSVVMGESGTVIEQFLRKMERIYTDPAVGEALDSIGVSIRDASGEFRSLIDIMNEISARGLGSEAYRVLEGFFPADLGQKTKQQLREFFGNIELITGIVQDAKDSTANFDDALIRANRSMDTLADRLDSAFTNLLTALGDITGFAEILNDIASSMQNTATKIGPGGVDVNAFAGANKTVGPGDLFYEIAMQNWEAYQKTFVRLGETTRQMYEPDAYISRNADPGFWADFAERIVQSLPGNFFGSVAGPENQQRYLEVALQSFMRSEYHDPTRAPDSQIQDFLLYMSQYQEDVNRLFTGLNSISDATRGNAAALATNAAALATQESAAYLAASALIAAANAAAVLSVTEPVFYQGQRQMLGALGWQRATGSGGSIYPFYPSNEKNADIEERRQEAERQAELERRLAEQASKRQQSEWESLMRSFESSWNSMIDDLLKPTPVTAGDVALSKIGKYGDKWDEPLRQFRADINNLIAGRPEEYGSMARFAPYIDQDLLATALGSNQETKESLLRGIEDIVAGKYTSLGLPPEYYNKEALVSSAREWIANKQQASETRAAMEGWLRESGISDEFAKMFLDDQETPGIVKALTGGWSPDEITSEVSSSVPDVAGIVGDQFSDYDWATLFANSVATSVQNNYDALVSAGEALGGPITEGAGSTFVSTIVPQIIEAIALYYQ